MVNSYPLKKYPAVGACGLDCGLCSRFHTDGKSKCPGCCGPDFYDRHPSCGLVNCCVKQRGLETCALCVEWQECPKLFQVIESAQVRDSFISYKTLPSNINFIQNKGINEFLKKEMEKQKILLHLLDNFDDGRSKLFYCTACQLIPIAKLEATVKNTETVVPRGAALKDKNKIMRSSINTLAKSLKIDLVLRNKSV